MTKVLHQEDTGASRVSINASVQAYGLILRLLVFNFLVDNINSLLHCQKYINESFITHNFYVEIINCPPFLYFH